REARLESELEGTHRLTERIAHPRRRLVDQDRAHVHTARRDHAAGAALQRLGLARRELAAAQRLPRLVGAEAPLLGADPEERENLQPRTGEADLPHPVEESRPPRPGPR